MLLWPRAIDVVTIFVHFAMRVALKSIAFVSLALKYFIVELFYCHTHGETLGQKLFHFEESVVLVNAAELLILTI